MSAPNANLESAVFTKEVSDEALESIGWWDLFFFVALGKSWRLNGC